MKTHLVALLCGAIATLASGGNPVHAATITYVLSGSITNIFVDDNPPPLTSIAHGDIWSATLVIDSETPDSDDRPTQGVYDQALLGTYSVGSIVSYGVDDFPSNFIFVRDNHFQNADQVSIDANGAGGLVIDGLDVRNTRVNLVDSTGTIFQDPLLTSTIGMTIHDFDSAEFLLFLGGDDGYIITGSVTSVTASIVPTPAAILLFAFSIVPLAWVGKRKHDTSA